MIMFKPQRNSGHGGWQGGDKRFGDRKPWERNSGGRDFARPAMHPAVCAECGNPCEVPFRPIEGRPVYCTNCFKKDETREQRRPAGSEFRQPKFEERRANAAPFARSESFAPSANTAQFADQLKSLNAKLDAILKILTPVVPPVATKIEEVKEEALAPKKVKKEKVAKKTKK